MTDNELKCLEQLNNEKDKIARIDNIDYFLLDRFQKQIDIEEENEITLILFDFRIIKDTFYMYSDPFGDTHVEWFLVRRNDFPYVFDIEEKSFKKTYDKAIEIDDEHKIDFRKVAFIIVNNEIIYDYSNLSCYKVYAWYLEDK